MAGYLDESFLGSGSKSIVVYTPKSQRSGYRASVGGSVPAVIETKARVVTKTRKPRGPRTYKATVETPTPTETIRPVGEATVDSDAAFREKAKAIGQWNEKRRAKERRLEESQFQKQLRREAALAKRKQRARKQSIRKHKRIARKMWRRLI